MSLMKHIQEEEQVQRPERQTGMGHGEWKDQEGSRQNGEEGAWGEFQGQAKVSALSPGKPRDAFPLQTLS